MAQAFARRDLRQHGACVAILRARPVIELGAGGFHQAVRIDHQLAEIIVGDVVDSRRVEAWRSLVIVWREFAFVALRFVMLDP